MRPVARFALALVVLAAAALAPARAEDTSAPPIKRLEVIVTTADEFGASTYDAVTFSLGPSYEWALEAPAKRPFKNGATDRFVLAPHGLAARDIKWIRLQKKQGDDWLLEGIEIWIDGKPYYRNGEINVWFDDMREDWTAPELPKTK